MLIREGTSLSAYNGIVTGFKEDGVDIDQAATFDQVASGSLQVNNSIFYNNGQSLDAGDCGAGSVMTGSKNILGCDDVAKAEGTTTTAAFLSQAMDKNRFMDPGLRDPHSRFVTTVQTEEGPVDVVVLASPDLRPHLDSAAADANFVRTPPDSVTLPDGRVVQGFFDTSVDYVGGVDPVDNWARAGWTYYGPF